MNNKYADYRIAIILPAYNEEMTIKDCIESFHQELPQAEIFVINNNSSDQTEVIAREALGKIGRGEVLNEPRQGKANAIKLAFQEVDADIYIISDADMTYPSSQIKELIDPIVKKEADIVVGDRHKEGHYNRENSRRFHQFGNNLVKNLINFLFRANINDVMSGYRAMTRRFVKSYPILCKGFELETEMTLHTLDKGFRIREVSVNYKDRPEGSFSKLSTFKDGINVLKTIISIFGHYRPMVFFGILSIVFSFLGLIFGYVVIEEYIQLQTVHRIPLAILSTGLMIFSILSFSIGVMLNALSRVDRFNYMLHLSKS